MWISLLKKSAEVGRESGFSPTYPPKTESFPHLSTELSTELSTGKIFKTRFFGIFSMGRVDYFGCLVAFFKYVELFFSESAFNRLAKRSSAALFPCGKA
jgi:hypothetical protein